MHKKNKNFGIKYFFYFFKIGNRVYSLLNVNIFIRGSVLRSWQECGEGTEQRCRLFDIIKRRSGCGVYTGNNLRGEEEEATAALLHLWALE